MAITPEQTKSPSIKLNVNDALRLAAKDKRFAATLLKDPKLFAGPFNLADEEVKALKNITKERLSADIEYE